MELELLVLDAVEIPGRADYVELRVHLPLNSQDAGDNVACFLGVHKLPVSLIDRHIASGQLKGDHSFWVGFGRTDAFHCIPSSSALGVRKNTGSNCGEKEEAEVQSQDELIAIDLYITW